MKIIKDVLGRDVHVFADEKQIFSDAEKNCTAEHNQMNEKAIDRYLDPEREEEDKKILDPNDLNDVIDVIIENPVIKLEAAGSIEITDDLFEYVPEDYKREISDEAKEFTVVAKDPEVLTVDGTTVKAVKTTFEEDENGELVLDEDGNPVVKSEEDVNCGIGYIIVKWPSGVIKELRVEIGTVAKVKDLNDPSYLSDPNSNPNNAEEEASETEDTEDNSENSSENEGDDAESTDEDSNSETPEESGEDEEEEESTDSSDPEDSTTDGE